jgi:hypothetical protein
MTLSRTASQYIVSRLPNVAGAPSAEVPTFTASPLHMAHFVASYLRFIHGQATPQELYLFRDLRDQVFKLLWTNTEQELM